MTVADLYPLSSDYLAPATLTGPCLIALCGPLGGDTTCTAILGQCQSGSSNFTSPGAPGQSFACDYSSKTFITDSVSQNGIGLACGMQSLNAAVTFSGTQVQFSNPSISGSKLNNSFTLSTVNPPMGAPVWPTTAIDLSSHLDLVEPFLVSASSSSSSSGAAASIATFTATIAPATSIPTPSASPSNVVKSSSNKNVNLSTLVISAGVVLSINLSTLA